jgi:hypothetical protein
MERSQLLASSTGQNPYLLGRGDPLTYVDPIGLDVIIAYGPLRDDTGKEIGETAANAIRDQLVDKGMSVDDIKVVKATDVKTAAAEIADQGGVVSSLVFLGHGLPGEVMTAEDQWTQLQALGREANVERGGVAVFVACLTMNTKGESPDMVKRITRMLKSSGVKPIGFTREMTVFEHGFLRPKDSKKAPKKITAYKPDRPKPKSGAKRMTIGAYILDAERRTSSGQIENP